MTWYNSRTLRNTVYIIEVDILPVPVTWSIMTITQITRFDDDCNIGYAKHTYAPLVDILLTSQ